MVAVWSCIQYGMKYNEILHHRYFKEGGKTWQRNWRMFIHSFLQSGIHWSKVSRRKSSFKSPTRQEQSPSFFEHFLRIYFTSSPVVSYPSTFGFRVSHHFHQRTEGRNIKEIQTFSNSIPSPNFSMQENYTYNSVSMNYISISRNFPFVWVTQNERKSFISLTLSYPLSLALSLSLSLTQ